jgi:hypothetical protein
MKRNDAMMRRGDSAANLYDECADRTDLGTSKRQKSLDGLYFGGDGGGSLGATNNFSSIGTFCWT